jgi:hypothetical protein
MAGNGRPVRFRDEKPDANANHESQWRGWEFFHTSERIRLSRHPQLHIPANRGMPCFFRNWGKQALMRHPMTAFHILHEEGSANPANPTNQTDSHRNPEKSEIPVPM